jgi:phosphate transport system substrate-binding protein
MKKLLLSIAVCAVCASCYDPNVQESKSFQKFKTDTAPSKTEIRITGSTTMKPIMENVVKYFVAGNEGVNISIDATGSNEGLKSIWHDSSDIAMSSHKISDSVVAQFRKNKVEFAEFLLAGDALVFVVNTNNTVQKLTSTQIEQIFSGQITNWKQVGGKDAPISLYSRDVNSGTYNFFKESVLPKQALPTSVQYLKDNGSVMDAVSKDKNAIGYASFSSLDYSVEPLGVSFDGGATFVLPRVETVNNLKYKLFRGLYLYYKPEAYAKIKAFLDTVKSDTVQKIIVKNGYIPLSHKLIHNQ